MEYMLMPIRRYADFKGRSRRKEYWMFVLLQMIVIGAFVLLTMLFGGAESDLGAIVVILGALVFLGAFFLPSIAVQVRRFHDQDKSGWFILLGFIPYVGSLVLLVFMCLPGTQGDNRFGPDPKGYGHGGVFD